MKDPFVIALDGPAGAGKSTVGKAVADRLGFFYFDTGSLYRAAALQAHNRGVDLRDEDTLAKMVRELDVRVGPASVDDGRQYDVLLAGRDVSQAIRGPDVEAIVSTVAASPAIRDGLIDAQRRQVQGRGTVMAGRDIGTVVCPAADLKVYLDASPLVRARRRLGQAGRSEDELASVLAGIEHRDAVDSGRFAAPLAIADDAVVVSTDDLTIEQVVDSIVALVPPRIVKSNRGASIVSGGGP